MLVISPHPVAELKKELIEEHKAQYWIGCDSRLMTTVDFVVPNVVAEFPMIYLIDCRGRIVDYGEELEAKIEYLLQEVFDPALGRELHKALRSAQQKYESGMIGTAWKFAGRRLEDEDPAVVADAKFLRGRCEAYGAWKQLMLQREIDAGRYPTVVPALEEFEKAFRGMPTGAWASETRRVLRKDPKVKAELEAWMRLEKAIEKEEKATYDRKKMKAVHKEYQAIIDKYPGTLAAQEARRRLS